MVRLDSGVQFALAALALSLCSCQGLTTVPEIQGAVEHLSSAVQLQAPPAVSTSFADTQNVRVLDDGFSPHFEPLSALPRSSDGSFLLMPGAYEGDVSSYCLHAGTHGPTSGAGYLYAPLKGARAGIIHSILVNSRQHPEEPQNGIQMLIWGVEARSKVSELPPSAQHAANALLSAREIEELNGGALGMIPPQVFQQLVAALPPEARELVALQDSLRNALGRTDATFEEIERVAILAGPANHDGMSIPRERWSQHPGGFFVRYLPSGYQHTKLQIYVPETASASKMALRFDAAAPVGGSTTPLYDPSSDVATPADTGAQRLGIGSVLATTHAQAQANGATPKLGIAAAVRACKALLTCLNQQVDQTFCNHQGNGGDYEYMCFALCSCPGLPVSENPPGKVSNRALAALLKGYSGR